MGKAGCVETGRQRHRRPPCRRPGHLTNAADFPSALLKRSGGFRLPLPPRGILGAPAGQHLQPREVGDGQPASLERRKAPMGLGHGGEEAAQVAGAAGHGGGGLGRFVFGERRAEAALQGGIAGQAPGVAAARPIEAQRLGRCRIAGEAKKSAGRRGRANGRMPGRVEIRSIPVARFMVQRLSGPGGAPGWKLTPARPGWGARGDDFGSAVERISRDACGIAAWVENGRFIAKHTLRIAPRPS